MSKRRTLETALERRMRRHLETLQNCYDTRGLLGAQSVRCVSYVPFCTNLCAIPGAHLLLQTRTRVLNGELDETFRRWYPQFRPDRPLELKAVA
jgi:hypothetical protein